MVAPTLSDYEYQYKDTGLKLNGSSVLPFFDVKNVTGLDMADFEAKIDDIDSQHGGAIYNKYAKPRLIVVEGILYANPSTIEATIDSANTNFLPDDTNWPFYYKHPGVAQRYINAKAIKFVCPTDTLRRIGAASFQIQLGAEDVVKRIDNPDTTYAVAGTNYSVTNSGNLPSFPIITITGAYTTINLINTSTGEALNINYTAIAGDVTVVDFRNRSVRINGIQNSNVATNTWWDINAGATIQTRYTVTGGPPTSVIGKTYSGWI